MSARAGGPLLGATIIFNENMIFKLDYFYYYNSIIIVVLL